MTEKFISSTIGMNVSHPAFSGVKLVRFNFYSVPEGVRIEAISGHNLSPIHKITHKIISSEEFSNRDYDYYDDQVEFWWAAGLMGCNVGLTPEDYNCSYY